MDLEGETGNGGERKSGEGERDRESRRVRESGEGERETVGRMKVGRVRERVGREREWEG